MHTDASWFPIQFCQVTWYRNLNLLHLVYTATGRTYRTSISTKWLLNSFYMQSVYYLLFTQRWLMRDFLFLNASMHSHIWVVPSFLQYEKHIIIKQRIENSRLFNCYTTDPFVCIYMDIMCSFNEWRALISISHIQQKCR